MDKQKNDNKNDFFEKRIGDKLKKLREYLGKNNFVVFFLAKKQAGKGTYAKFLGDLTDGKIIHISVGDLVRDAAVRAQDSVKRQDLIDDLKKYYKGKEKLDKVLEIFIEGSKSTAQLLPTEVIMALIEQKISENQGKSIIVDGFPRSREQVTLALKMQADFEKKGTPSAFMEINCPEDVLLRRYVDRRVCPICKTPRNIKLLLTKEIEYDEKTGEFHLICERPECNKARFVAKQGDQDGLEQVKERQREVQAMVDKVKNEAPHLHIVVHNSIPLKEAHKHDSTDFTEEAELIWDTQKREVIRKFKPMVAINDEGEKVYSRWPEPVVVDMVDQLADWLESRPDRK